MLRGPSERKKQSKQKATKARKKMEVEEEGGGKRWRKKKKAMSGNDTDVCNARGRWRSQQVTVHDGINGIPERIAAVAKYINLD